MDSQSRSGEPYGLSGKRLVFTNWYYVRPGSFDWCDQRGNAVTVVGSLGPFEAHFRGRDLPHGVRLVACQAERVGPLIQPEYRWEEQGIQINTLLRDGGRYRAWGLCYGRSGEEESFICYFESDDGLEWKRPKLGIWEIAGSRDNNLLDSKGGIRGSAGPRYVFVDPSAPGSERYKLAAEWSIARDHYEQYRERRPDGWEPRADRGSFIVAVWGGVSPDGLQWQFLPDPLVVEHSDGAAVIYYDERLGKYVAYMRNWMVGPCSEQARQEEGPTWSAALDQGLSWPKVGRRAISRSESEDFPSFPLSQVILEAGPDMPPSDVLYLNCRTAIPGAPDHHLMFPTIWHTANDTTSVRLASSHDGKVWNYVPGPPVLATSAFGEWDGGCVFAHPNLVELPGGDFALPYCGYIFPHKYPRGLWKFAFGLAVWRKGRLVALEAPDVGEFATVALVPPGRRLRVNARTQRAGSLRVEAAGLDGKPFPGRGFADSVPIIGDHAGALVTWKGTDSLCDERSSAVILRFRMQMAEIFGLTFE